MPRLSHEVDPLISYADLHDSASIEAKKMIFSCLIRVSMYTGAAGTKWTSISAWGSIFPEWTGRIFQEIKACLIPGGTADSGARTSRVTPTLHQYSKAEGLFSCENRP